MQNKYFKKVSQGQCFNQKEIKGLSSYLGLRVSYLHIFFLIILSVILVSTNLILLGAFTFFKKNIYLAILFNLLLIGGVLFFLFKYFLKRKKNYLNVIDDYYQKKLSSYAEMKKYYTTFSPIPENYLKKSSVLFLTDGYYFVILEDFLIQTEYFFGPRYKNKYNKYPLLKILDKESILKRHVDFKLSDIAYYTIVGKIKEEIAHTNYDEYLHLFSEDDYNNYVEVHLKNFHVLTFGTNIYEVLKELLPLKEKINEK